MTSENYENFTEILKYSKELAENFWKRKDAQKCLFSVKLLNTSA